MLAFCSQIVLDSCQLLKLSDFTLSRALVNSEHEYDLKSLVHKLLNPRATDTLDSVQYTPSPFYSAPELYHGDAFSIASDLWSLGCVVYELSLGCRAFENTDPEQLLQSVLTARPNTVLPPSHTIASTLLTTLLTTQPTNRTYPYNT